MDYSVVVAVDKNSGEITAGIIDYIRTFTWDKKVRPLSARSTGAPFLTDVSL